MRAVIQRVNEASVSVDDKLISHIDKGLLIFIGFKFDDKVESFDKFIDKIVNLRIFEDANNKMNLSLKDVCGSVLLISQFTLYADTKKGYRPSFTSAMSYDDANVLYDIFIEKFKEKYDNIKTGIFGSDMKVGLINDGPVTIIMEE